MITAKNKQIQNSSIWTKLPRSFDSYTLGTLIKQNIFLNNSIKITLWKLKNSINNVSRLVVMSSIIHTYVPSTHNTHEYYMQL